MNRKVVTLLALIGVLLFVALSVGCNPPPGPTTTPEVETPVPTEIVVTPEPVPSFADPIRDGDCSENLCAEIPRSSGHVSTNQRFYDNQLILTGTASNLECAEGVVNRALADDDATTNVGIELQRTIPLDYIVNYPVEGDGEDNVSAVTGGVSLPHELMSSLNTNLYEFASQEAEEGNEGQDLDETNETILATIFDAIADSECVTPENNEFLMGDLNLVAGLPWGVEGAPWGVEGAPWGVEGAPWGVEGAGLEGSEEAEASTQIVTANDIFWGQWALGPDNGVGLISNGVRQTDLNGSGAEIAVFDTSPFTLDSTGEGEPTSIDHPFSHTFDGWLDEPMTLKVTHPVAVPEKSTDSAYADLSDHGIFVSSLSWALAPGADIRLIRVLNENARGDLASLVEALHKYAQYRLGEKNRNGSTGDLNDTILNMSLGVPAEESMYPTGVISAMVRLAEAQNFPIDVIDRMVAGKSILALDFVTQIITNRGGIIVAAAGNDSADASPRISSRLPAAYPGVIGVEAANTSRNISCYSNDGILSALTVSSADHSNLRAPGGDGGPQPTPGPSTPTPVKLAGCYPLHYTCETDPGNCPFGVVGILYSARPDQGIGMWVGSSFATPLVAGLAALELDNGTNPDQLLDHSAFGLSTTTIINSDQVELSVVNSLNSP